ncbi:MAG: HNH endonuclease [Ignavibacteriaceae bacterium]|nr:HNH endonuclease [Ignavibacteriaceae bacterium]
MAKGLNSYIRKADEVIVKEIDYCAYCLQTNVPLAIDHIIPPMHGGDSSLTNLTRACMSCNSSKRDFAMTQFYMNSLRDRDQLSLEIMKYLNRLRTERKRHGLNTIQGQYFQKKIKTLYPMFQRKQNITVSIQSGTFRIFK